MSREMLVLSFPYSKEQPQSLNAHRGTHLPTGLVDTMDQLLAHTEGLEKSNRRSGQYGWEKEEQELNRLLEYVIRLRCN